MEEIKNYTRWAFFALIVGFFLIVGASLGRKINDRFIDQDNSPTWKEVALKADEACTEALESAEQWESLYDSIKEFREPKIKQYEPVIKFSHNTRKENEAFKKRNYGLADSALHFVWDSIISANTHRTINQN